MRDVVLETVDLTRLEGDVDYASRSAEVRMEAWRDDVPVLRVEGDVPIDLSLVGVEDRTPDDRDMDLRAEADSLPAAFILALLQDLEDVEGTISGEVGLRGSVEAPVAEGTIRLHGGAWTVGAIGVRQEGVEATLEVGADDRVRVTATGRAGGTVAVEGTVTLATLTDPELDLAIRMAEFAAVDRRDVEGTVSGEVQLTGSFMQPVIAGDLRVDEGVIHLEEFQRAAGVVDLSDPRFFAYVDTALFSGRPLLAETRNPFMDNLRVNVAMAVERNTWLRSAELNVEMGGQLIVVYDRPAQDLVLIGQLQAVRGQYTFLGRTFEVRSGTVEFIGTPGINPNLDIQAVASIRGRENPFDITANLSGTLVDPRVSLTTDEGAVPESDLVSYLIFGRPSTEVNALFAGSDGGDALFGQGISLASSALATSLGAIAQGWGFVDYLAITQASSGFSDLAAGTQIEAGQYFARDYFAALTIRPWSGTAAAGGLLGGFRLEWQANSEYHVELFAEDRFLRGGGFGFQELGLRSQVIYGLQLVREWGY
jgi:autotransporter translocation and assembly factor TamB